MNMLKSVINFMNQEDKNGEWFEFYNEYQNGEVDFDYVVDYLHETLFVWMEYKPKQEPKGSFFPENG